MNYTHRVIVFLLWAGFVLACSPGTKEESNPAGIVADSVFVRLSEEFLDGYLAWRPQSGTYLGLHEYDGKVKDYSKSSLDAELVV